MPKIKLDILDDCKLCKEGMKWYRKLLKRNKNAYMRYIMRPLPKSDEEFWDRRIPGLLLIPDYNYEGYLTHFHIQKEIIEDEKK